MEVACRSRLPRARSYLIVVLGSACEAASCTSRSGTPASSAAVRNACLKVCGPMALVIPARRGGGGGGGGGGAAGALADDRGSPVAVQPTAVRGQEDRPRAAFADGQVDRSRGTRRERDGDDLPALAGDHQRPVPALDAHGLDVGAGGFGNRSPLRASREISACSAGGPSPTATSSASSSLRSRPVACDS